MSTECSRRRWRSSSGPSFLFTAFLYSCQLMTHSMAASSSGSDSTYPRNQFRRNLQQQQQREEDIAIQILPFALDLGYIITSITNPDELFNNAQQSNIETLLQSALNDFLTEALLSSSSSYYTSVYISNVNFNSTTILSQQTDPRLQKTICLTQDDCITQHLILGATRFVSGDDYPFKGCFRRLTSPDTIMFGLGGSVEDMSTLELNDNLERVFCYTKVNNNGDVSAAGEIASGMKRSGGGSSGDGDERRRRLGDKEKVVVLVENDGGGGVGFQSDEQRRKLSSVQSAKFTVIVTGGQAVPNSGEGSMPTENDLHESILAQIAARGDILAAKVRSLAAASSDSTLLTLFSDVDTVMISDDQPSFDLEENNNVIGKSYISVDGCLKPGDVYEAECASNQHTSELHVNCCSGTIGSDLQCRRPSCFSTDSYAAAEAHCANSGMRVCTLAEVETGVCCDKGCSFNRHASWTSDGCLVTDDDTIPMMIFHHPTTSPTMEPSLPPTISLILSPTHLPSRESTTIHISTSLSPSSADAQDTNPCPDGQCLDPKGECQGKVQCFVDSCEVTSCGDGEICTSNYCGGCNAVCSALLTTTSPSPSSNPCPGGQCLDSKGECQSEVQCLVDPCEVTSCGDGESCASNYCGGCNAVCSALMTTAYPSTTPPNAGPETPRPTYIFGMPSPPPKLPPAPTNFPATFSPNPTLDEASPPALLNVAQMSGNIESGDFRANNTLIIAFASVGSLVVAFAIGLTLFVVMKHRRPMEKEPEFETKFNSNLDSGSAEEGIECYDYNETKYIDQDKKTISRFGPASALARNAPVGKRGDKISVVKTDQPLSRLDGNGVNDFDDVVDDLALDFLAGTGNRKMAEDQMDKVAKNFPFQLKLVSSFNAFQAEDMKDEALSFEEEQRGKIAQDFCPKLSVDDTFEAFQGEEFEVDVEEDAPTENVTQRRPDPDGQVISSYINDASKKQRWEREVLNGSASLGINSSLMAPSPQYHHAQKLNKKFAMDVATDAQRLNEKFARDISNHRAKMNSFLQDSPEPESRQTVKSPRNIFNSLSLPQRVRAPRAIKEDDSVAPVGYSFARSEDAVQDIQDRGAKMNGSLQTGPELESLQRVTKSSLNIFNPSSLPQRVRTPRTINEIDSIAPDEYSFARSEDDHKAKEPRPRSNKSSVTAQKKFVAPSRFPYQRNKTKKRRQNESETSPDRRFFAFDGDDDTDETEAKLGIPNLIEADEKSGMTSAVSSIGQVDWRGRERADKRKQTVRFELTTKENDEDAEAKLKCLKTKSILSQTLERSVLCSSRVVSPVSESIDKDDNQVSRPWLAIWDNHFGNKKGPTSHFQGPSAADELGYQSSNYDPDSDWDFDDNDITVGYSAESFMPSTLKGVGFDLKR